MGRDGARPAALAFLAVAGLCAPAASAAAPALARSPARGATAAEAFVRVDEVGYASAAPKRAYLMSSIAAAGAPFSVRRASDGATVLSASVGASLGSWSTSFRHVYALDLSSLTTPGSYMVSVGGPAPASSPPFAVGPAATLYAGPLRNALSFYENERDGPEYIPSALRAAPAHLNDSDATTYLTPAAGPGGGFAGELTRLGTSIDASGGWWDAGDYLKFVQTTSYTVDLLLAGVRDFPAQMGASSPQPDFTAEARFGVEWLLRMWDERTRTLYYQVGIGEGNRDTVGDHDIWRLAQQDDTYGGEDPRFRYIRHRPVFRAGPPAAPVSPNLAGRDAAAFALCFQVFRSTRPELAARCLRAGEDIYALADPHPHARLLTAIPFGFYPEHEWRDDLELGATELALALSSPGALPAGLPQRQPSFYLAQAAAWAKAFIAHAHGSSDPLNLYDVSGLAEFELVRALRLTGGAGGLEVSEDELVADLRRQLTAAVRQARRDPFGFGFPWNAADTTSHGDGLVVMAGEYRQLTGDASFSEAADGWMANVLGANAWGSSLIIGDGSTFPHCPQHQVANLLGSLDGSPPVLAGAAVEGPSDERSSGEVEHMRACPPAGGEQFARFDGHGSAFADEVQSFTTVEPAIDLTASSPLAFAWQITAPAALP